MSIVNNNKIDKSSIGPDRAELSLVLAPESGLEWVSDGYQVALIDDTVKPYSEKVCDNKTIGGLYKTYDKEGRVRLEAEAAPINWVTKSVQQSSTKPVLAGKTGEYSILGEDMVAGVSSTDKRGLALTSEVWIDIDSWVLPFKEPESVFGYVKYDVTVTPQEGDSSVFDGRFLFPGYGATATKFIGVYNVEAGGDINVKTDIGLVYLTDQEGQQTQSLGGAQVIIRSTERTSTYSTEQSVC